MLFYNHCMTYIALWRKWILQWGKECNYSKGIFLLLLMGRNSAIEEIQLTMLNQKYVSLLQYTLQEYSIWPFFTFLLLLLLPMSLSHITCQYVNKLPPGAKAQWIFGNVFLKNFLSTRFPSQGVFNHLLI